MKKLYILFLIIGFICLPLTVQARGIHINAEGDYEADEDTFKPQRTVEFKTSKLADMLENGTRNRMDGVKSPKKQYQFVFGRNNQPNADHPDRRSYKWF